MLCSVHCVLVTPKRKLAGQLDITRTVLHFSFEFLVEGTGGSSVFSKFKDKIYSDCKNELGGSERLDRCRDSVIETNSILMQNQSNKIKHHRRWNITKVSPSLPRPLLLAHSLHLLSCMFSDKSSSLDTLPTTMYCNGDLL